MVPAQPRPAPGVMRGNVPPQNVPGMNMGGPGYQNAGEQLMMVLNSGGGGQYMREFPAHGRSPTDNREFSMADSDFPALSTQGGGGGGGAGGNSVGGSAGGAGAGLPPGSPQRKDGAGASAGGGAPMMANYPMMQMYGRMPQNFQQQQPPPPQQQPQPQQTPQHQPVPAAAPLQRQSRGSADVSQQYGLMGLLGLIRMTDRDLNTLALGTDLTTLGLNLNSAEPLYTTFSSPFSDAPASKDPYYLPESYTITPLSPPANMLTHMSDETLLYAFYTSPKDALQLQCAQELYKRGWRFHKEMQRWLVKAPGADNRVPGANYDRGPYFLYDPHTWEKQRQENLLVVHEKLEASPAGGK